MSLEDTQSQLFKDSLKSVYKMRKELEQQTDYIVSATAHEMAEDFKAMPNRVRQELSVLMEQYQDDPDRLVLALRVLEQKMVLAADSPWAKFQRRLKGNGGTMTRDDWKTLAACLGFFLSLPLVMATMGAIVNTPDGYLDLNSGQFIERVR